MNGLSIRRLAAVLLCACACSWAWSPAFGEAPRTAPVEIPKPLVPFVPEQPIVSAGALRAGMRGYLLTVLRGTRPERLPLEVVDVVPQKGEVSRSILVRLLPSANNRAGGVAQGMSGSPVYIGGRLAGAVGSGWSFSDHNLALVTPIEDMCAVFSRPDRPAHPLGRGPSPRGSGSVAPLSVAGLDGRSAECLAHISDFGGPSANMYRL